MRQLNIILSFLTLVTIFSCEKDQLLPVTDPNVKAPNILTPSPDYSMVIKEGDSMDIFTFVWSPVNYGVSTPISYTVTADSATMNFTNAVILGSSDNNTLTLTVQKLNDILINNMGLPPNVESKIEILVTSQLGNAETLTSDAIILSVTPYEKVEEEPEPVPVPDRLWVPGGYQGYSPAEAATIRKTAENIFEGYVYISSPTGIKFTSDPDYSHTNYGAGGEEGQLSIDNAPDIDIPEAGYYRFIVNTETLTYSADIISTWGIIGTATPGLWDSSTVMTFDDTNQVWTITQDLVPGALKFRANDNWDINFGPEDSNAYDGKLIVTDAAISIAEEGNYTITIDLGTTNSPYEYTYKVSKN